MALIKGRGGKREGAGRLPNPVPSRVMRVTENISKDEVEAIPSLKAAMVCWHVRIDSEPDSPRYHFLKEFLSELEEYGFDCRGC